MLDAITSLKKQFSEEIERAGTVEALEEIRIRALGRKGELTALLRSLPELPSEQRGEAGKNANLAKNFIEGLLSEKVNLLEKAKLEQSISSDWLDVSLNSPGSTAAKIPGTLHPISKTQYEIEDIFTSMGFQILDGPEAETEYYNFEALNIPKHHPARDMQDTFWTEDGNLLRTHTSAIQVRGLEKVAPPFRIVGPGRVFRYESIDASHENTFYQVEGMMVDRDISVSHLIFFMKQLLGEIFRRDVKIRLRPGYFPFVEPGFELDINCLICGGSGCSVCKQSGWVELLPCGLIHPNVLKSGGIDPAEWSGFAFGLGLNRLIMMRYGINDIRHFMSGDLRFMRQF
jgi:phenylalanyl-tRNA synthetase alpha chain